MGLLILKMTTLVEVLRQPPLPPVRSTQGDFTRIERVVQSRTDAGRVASSYIINLQFRSKKTSAFDSISSQCSSRG
jgi:hypothetical protein